MKLSLRSPLLIPFVILVILNLACIEIAASLYFKKHRNCYPFQENLLGRPFLTSKVDDPLSRTKVFDRDLGWEPYYETPFRERPTLHRDKPLLSVFGDSFTHGGEVSAEQTWAYYLSDDLKKGVLNLGGPAYSTDQAYLRYLKYADKLPTPYIAFVFRIENIMRNESCYRNFYFGYESGGLTKPRFYLKGNKLELFPNPIQRKEDIEKLTDMNFVLNELRKCDRWAPTDEALRRDFASLSFPYTRLLFDSRIWAAGKLNCAMGSDLPSNRPRETWNEPASKALTVRILNEFFSAVRARGRMPLFFFVPSYLQYIRHSKKEHVNGYPDFLEICHDLSLPCFDPFVQFADKLPIQDEKEFRTYFAPGLHYSPKMNRLYATELAAWLRSRKIVE